MTALQCVQRTGCIHLARCQNAGCCTLNTPDAQSSNPVNLGPGNLLPCGCYLRPDNAEPRMWFCNQHGAGHADSSIVKAMLRGEGEQAAASTDVSQNEVDLFISTLRAKGTPWGDGCASLIQKLWAGAAELQERRIEVEKYKAWAASCDPSPSETSVPLDYQLPCDVRLPPSATFGKGCTLGTLMHAFRIRENEPLVFDDDQAKAVREVIQQMRGDTPSLAHLSPENAQRILDRHMRWRETALGFFRQILDGRGTEDEWPALAEFVRNSTTVPLLQSPEKAGEEP